MWGAAIGAGVNGLASMATAFLNNRYAKEAAERSYKYSLKYLKQAPSAQRMGLEAAGYNPMLALGNIGSGTFSGGGQSAQMQVPDLAGGAKAGSEIVQNIVKGYKLQNKKTEKEIENLESDLDTKEIQRLQSEANTSLALSQTERSDLAYGRDIVGTAADIAGTAGSLYSAKAMSDVAKANAATAARNATVNEKRLGKYPKAKPSAPTVKTTPKAKTPNVGGLGHSAKSVPSVAKQMAKELLFLSPAALVGAGVGYGMKPVREREMKEHEKKNRDPVRNSSKWKWLMNFDRYHFNY